MPYLKKSAYRPLPFFRKGHVSTIYSGVVKKTTAPKYKRERIELPDGDFLLLDYCVKSSQKAVILCHGLEGQSTSNYNNTCAHYFLEHDYSVFAWNNRSCGGEMNHLPLLYHHASVNDLEAVVQTVRKRGYNKIYLVGFSMGGAQILNYLGRKPVPPVVKAAVAVSSPIQLKASADRIAKGLSKVYGNRFVKKIKRKVRLKAQEFPNILNTESIAAIRDLDDLAEHFLVPVHGFKDPDDYYAKVSPEAVLNKIETPVLLLNALDDPILGAAAFPVEFAQKSPTIFLETPAHGGHCAFPLRYTKYTYADIRALAFLEMWRPKNPPIS